jgi:hypothetical protein
MTNRMFEKGREAFLSGQINWLTDNIKAVLVDVNDYTADYNVHAFLTDIPSIARVATSGNLANKTATLGVADADDLTFSNVTGDQSEAVVLYKDTGVAGTSLLICYIDSATGLPVIPNSGPIAVVWDNGANKIFKL